MIEPAKVAISPNATRTVSWISPCGARSVPTKSNAMPASDKMAAINSCMSDSFFISSAKLQQKTEAAKKATSGSIRNLYFSLNGAVDANLAMRYAVAKEQKTGRKWRMSLYSP